MSTQEDKASPRAWALCVAVLLSLGHVATAQEPTPQVPATVGARADLNTTATALPPGGAAKCGTNHDLLVTAAWCQWKSECTLNDPVIVWTDPDCLAAWEAAGANTQPPHDPRKLLLVLNGRVLTGISAKLPSKGDGNLRFDLKRTPANNDAWNALVADVQRGLPLNVSVELENSPLRYGEVYLAFRLFPDYWWLAALLVALLFGAFLILARRSDIIRDVGREPKFGQRRPYSLARTQMAFWFFLVVASYLYIWLVTGNHDTLTQGVLVLIGISAATGLGAMVMDQTRSQEGASRHLALETERTALAACVPVLRAAMVSSPPPVDLPALQKELLEKELRLAEVTQSLASLPMPEPPVSQGMLIDILRDDTGVTFHRFQMVGWTLVLGVVFVTSVYRELVMPDFSATLLGLMGISSGTYLGFKLPQQQ
jgi:hypothetical protein